LRTALHAILIAAVALAAGCHRAPIPEADSADARVYVQRCGQCHMPYDPRMMTPAMWQAQVTMMEIKIHEAALPELSGDQRTAILDYLTRNSGSR
jgi:hypothetical protein